MSGDHDPSPLTAPIPTGWRTRWDIRPRLLRVRWSAGAIVQIVVAVTAAVAVARWGFGHATPLLAATVTISSLGLVRDARPIRVLETVAGMLVGILIAELLVITLGIGWWQLALSLALAMAAARFLATAPGFTMAAATQAAIVMILPIDVPFVRLLDGAIGGAAALAVTALIPRNTRRAELADAESVFSGFDDAVATVVQALRRGDRMRADRALQKARALSTRIDAWTASLESSLAIARISPILARTKPELLRHERVRSAMDLSVRNLRVIARRALYVEDDGAKRPLIADVIAEIQRGATLVHLSLTDISYEPLARESLRAVAVRLDPGAMLPDAAPSDQNLILSLRPLVVDLLTAAGMPGEQARSSVPRL
ncbi:uncharacterized membrane protein YgaE (UPF0421/DUF939 family) [Microbacterium endophyticum]|uniref:Uncharacterized membrane protein YgaE (UPF0421/DUF939 family) n=1 Tax=Microbacterium endophyticum TaxID=1526412 RepID=A0A7W4YLD2_9MICO|nr:FUSC family protein [Microbacterium endophyticum]MBB2975038.1 uncharacterized membrane protein YgaE (UPF0421/DUF939 family) [Microbacterium endophyticum]NIK37422.1 uncharacterized membrane protein YgaE (UPF0421/DUF939 family) [Microbacterium endophyticum]